jgi:hypothetical protein
MNKRMLISVIVIFVMSLGLGFVVHGLLLKPDYSLLSNLYRTEPDAGAHFPFMILAHLLFAIGFVWIYGKGKEAKPFMAQGIRFGIAVAVLSTIPTFLIYFAVQPLSSALVLKQIVFDTIGVILMGIVVAALNQ